MDNPKIMELREDVKELNELLNNSKRQRVKDILTLEIRKLETEISKSVDVARSTEILSGSHDTSANPPIAHGKVHHARLTKEISTYAWDQSDKFMKIYVDLKGVHEVSAGQIAPEYYHNSFKIKISDLNGADFVLHIGKLHEDIVPTDSFHKVKTDKILVMLKKAKEKQTWPYVVQKGTKKPEAPAMQDNDDPNDGLMKMMRKMYDDGDDEMKRTIEKSWYEAQHKKTGMDGLQ